MVQEERKSLSQDSTRREYEFDTGCDCQIIISIGDSLLRVVHGALIWFVAKYTVRDQWSE